MIYSLIKAYARLAIKIYCRKIIVENQEWLQAKGPLLLACNHPNSFLDGVILTTLFSTNVYSLARGDAFKHPVVKTILRWLHLLPVYRTSEGIENLEHNYSTFNACKEVFRNKGVVLIFSEGRCINEWHLRPLKKGTARLAISSWQEGIELTVLPVGINYNSFRNFGKNVFIHFGQPLQPETILQHRPDGRMHSHFNEELATQLTGLVYEIETADKAMWKQKLFVWQSPFKKIVLALPALAGVLCHWPLYLSVKTYTNKRFSNDHFDSVMVGLLLLLYPLYLLLFFLLAYFVADWVVALASVMALPFTAWSFVQLKSQPRI